jgi:CheY-like chemotaxis protein
MRPLERKPIDPPVENGQTAKGGPAVQQRSEKLGVLVVDDEDFVRIMVQLGLEHNGFDVWLASNGREAIQLYQTHRERIAVVLLDLRMPVMDGPQTLDALRELNPEVRVCIMSGDMGSDGPEGLRQRGAAHVIAKPFRLDRMANVLRLLANGEPAGQ